MAQLLRRSRDCVYEISKHFKLLINFFHIYQIFYNLRRNLKRDQYRTYY